MAAPGHHSPGPERVEFDADVLRVTHRQHVVVCMHCVMFVSMCVCIKCFISSKLLNL